MKRVDLSNNVQMGTQGFAELAKIIVKKGKKGKVCCYITAEELAALSPAIKRRWDCNLSEGERHPMIYARL